MKTKSITVERLRELVHYDPCTGVFTWLQDRGPRHAGEQAGTITKQGYRQLALDRSQYRANRMAVLYMTGELPKGQVDHINGDRLDDRYENLRDVSHGANQENRKRAASNNKSGLLGVFFVKRTSRWTARIRKGGKDHYIGYFDSAEEAHEAYIAKKREVHPHSTL